MAFLNIPLKSVEASLVSVVGIESMPWYNPLLFPVAPGDPTPAPSQRDFRWRVVMGISEQQQSSYISRQPGKYNGQDISVGQWISNLTTGQAWQIISIESKTVTEVTAIVQDVYRYNTFRDPVGNGNGNPVAGTYVIFNISDAGNAQIDPVPASGISAQFSPNIVSRFQYINLQYDYPLYQDSNTFSVNDVIAADPTTNSFVKSDETHKLVVGRVTSISDTIPGWFTINPVQKIVDNLDYLPGGVGDIIYASVAVPGDITVLPNGAPLYVKLRDNTQSISVGTSPGPTTANNVFQINGIDITVLAPANIAAAVTAINLEQATTGVSATSQLAPSSVETTLSLFYGEPALWASSSPASATINGVSVTFNITSVDPGYEDYARAEQMAESINLVSIPNIAASTVGTNLMITNTAGGAITIVNTVLDINSVGFAGVSSGSGLALSTAASSNSQLILTADDARAINLLDVIGSTLADFGLSSVENGVKACALYIQDGLRSSENTVVLTLTQLNDLTPLIGDTAYVIDSDDGNGNNVGEWSMWLYDGSAWVQTSNQDSASTDAKSLEYTVGIGSPGAITVGKISTGRRVTLITVEVTEAFNGTASLQIGYQVDNPTPPPAEPSALMSSGIIDLNVVGTYTASSDILFGTDTVQGDVTVTADFTNIGNTEGTAQIIVSYL